MTTTVGVRLWPSAYFLRAILVMRVESLQLTIACKTFLVAAFQVIAVVIICKCKEQSSDSPM